MSEPENHACLVVADESEEFPNALVYAGLLAKRTGWRLVMVRVIEPSDPAPWASITDEIRRQARAAAESLTQRFAAEVWAECGVTVETVLREGDLKRELSKFLDEDGAIKLMVLASAAPPGGPGPLVKQMSKGGFGARHIPVLVVPGALRRHEVRALALPGVPVAEAEPPNLTDPTPGAT